MTDSISIPALRERNVGSYDGAVLLETHERDALVEAVEAARGFDAEYAWTISDAHGRLRAALARFDFGEV